MSSNWIKMRTELARDPDVLKIASTLQLEVDMGVGKLHRVWSWADAHTTNGIVKGVSLEAVDSIVGHTGFAQSLIEVRWLNRRDGALAFPKWDRHNSASAKLRAQGARRMARKRKRDASSVTNRAPTERAAKSRKDQEIDPGMPSAPIGEGQAITSGAGAPPTAGSAKHDVLGMILSIKDKDGVRVFDPQAAASIASHPNASAAQVAWAIERFSATGKKGKPIKNPGGWIRKLIEDERTPSGWMEKYRKRLLMHSAAADRAALERGAEAARRAEEMGNRSAHPRSSMDPGADDGVGGSNL